MTIDVRCPYCNTLLFKAESVRTGQIEIVCRKCRRLVTWHSGTMRPRQVATAEAVQAK